MKRKVSKRKSSPERKEPDQLKKRRIDLETTQIDFLQFIASVIHVGNPRESFQQIIEYRQRSIPQLLLETTETQVKLLIRQFSDPRASLRELIVNGVDATLRQFTNNGIDASQPTGCAEAVKVTVDEHHIQIQDSGDGLNFPRFLAFITPTISTNTNESNSLLTGRFGKGAFSIYYYLMHSLWSTNGQKQYPRVQLLSAAENQWSLQISLLRPSQSDEKTIDQFLFQNEKLIGIKSEALPENDERIEIESRAEKQKIKLKFYVKNCRLVFDFSVSEMLDTETSGTCFDIYSQALGTQAEIISFLNCMFQIQEDYSKIPILINGRPLQPSCPLEVSPILSTDGSTNLPTNQIKIFHSNQITGQGILTLCEKGKTIISFSTNTQVFEVLSLDFHRLPLAQDRESIDYHDQTTIEALKVMLCNLVADSTRSSAIKVAMLNSLHPLLVHPDLNLIGFVKNLIENNLSSSSLLPLSAKQQALLEFGDHVCYIHPDYLNAESFLPLFRHFKLFTHSRNYYIYLITQLNAPIAYFIFNCTFYIFIDEKLLFDPQKMIVGLQGIAFNFLMLKKYIECQSPRKLDFSEIIAKILPTPHQVDNNNHTNNQNPLAEEAKILLAKYQDKTITHEEIKTMADHCDFRFTQQLLSLNLSPYKGEPEFQLKNRFLLVACILDYIEQKKENMPKIKILKFNFFKEYLDLFLRCKELSYVIELFIRHVQYIEENKLSPILIDYSLTFLYNRIREKNPSFTPEQCVSSFQNIISLAKDLLGSVEEVEKLAWFFEASAMEDYDYFFKYLGLIRALLYKLSIPAKGKFLYLCQMNPRYKFFPDLDLLVKMQDSIFEGIVVTMHSTITATLSKTTTQYSFKISINFNKNSCQYIDDITTENLIGSKLIHYFITVKMHEQGLKILNPNSDSYKWFNHFLLPLLSKRPELVQLEEEKAREDFLSIIIDTIEAACILKDPNAPYLPNQWLWLQSLGNSLKGVSNKESAYALVLDALITRLETERQLKRDFFMPFILSFLYGDTPNLVNAKTDFPDLEDQSAPWLHEIPIITEALGSSAKTVITSACTQTTNPFAFVHELIKNSIEASASIIKIEVAGIPDDQYLYMTFADNGVGFSEEGIYALLTPGRSTKSTQGLNPNFGWGFFTLFKYLEEGEEVAIISPNSIPNNVWVLRKTEVGLKLNQDYKNFPDSECPIKIILKKKFTSNTILDLILFQAKVLEITRFYQDRPIHYNGASIKFNEAKAVLEIKMNLAGTSICVQLHRNTSGIYRGSLKIAEIPSDYLNILPNWLRDTLHNRGLEFVIHLESAEQSHNRAALLADSTRELLCREAMLKLAITHCQHLLATDEQFAAEILPKDFWHKFTRYRDITQSDLLDTSISLQTITERIVSQIKEHYEKAYQNEEGMNVEDMQSIQEKIDLLLLKENINRLVNSLEDPTLRLSFFLHYADAENLSLHQLRESLIAELMNNKILMEDSTISKSYLKKTSDRDIQSDLESVFKKLADAFQQAPQSLRYLNKFFESFSQWIYTLKKAERNSVSTQDPYLQLIRNYLSECATKLFKRPGLEFQFKKLALGRLAQAPQSSNIVRLNLDELNPFVQMLKTHGEAISALQFYQEDLEIITSWLETLAHEITHTQEKKNTPSHTELFYSNLRARLRGGSDCQGAFITAEQKENALTILRQCCLDFQDDCRTSTAPSQSSTSSFFQTQLQITQQTIPQSSHFNCST